MNIAEFKPNLIPNNPKGEDFEEKRNKVIKKNGGIEKYYAIFKKDGCRLELGLSDRIVSRALKEPKSILVRKRFKKLNELCVELKIVLEGEFYMHGLKFNEIFRYFSNEDVTSEKYYKKLEKELKKDPAKFAKDYNNRSIPFLTSFHRDLKFWMFDGIILDRPDLVGYEERMKEIYRRLSVALETKTSSHYFSTIEYPILEEPKSLEELDKLYLEALELEFEGLVLVHKKHEYKFGRNSINQGTLLKMKDDAREFDGIILNVMEATKVKEGVERTKNELGRSVTSQKKDDREFSGKAKGFLIQFEDLGTFTVSLKGFDDEAKRELLENKENYIGRHFKYTAMKPVKDFPRHAHFDCWRDEK